MPRKSAKKTAKKTEWRTLHCELGDHDYEAPVKRGKRPVNCPEHKPAPEPKAPKADASIAAGIRWVRAQRGSADSCECGITEDTTREEIRALNAGCTSQRGYVCPTLDAIRRRIGYGPDS